MAALSGRVTYEVRVATARDIPRVLAFWDLAAEGAHRPVDDSGAVAALIERDPAALTLALHGDLIVGTLIAGWDGWRFHLYRLAVHPDHRRRGVAQLLLVKAEARFVEFGSKRADAMVLDENDLAHGFWANAGYRRQSEWSRWVKPLPP